eukprot:scaffold212094_cov40-Tisochrysis_lutea.AAC.4
MGRKGCNGKLCDLTRTGFSAYTGWLAHLRKSDRERRDDCRRYPLRKMSSHSAAERCAISGRFTLLIARCTEGPISPGHNMHEVMVGAGLHRHIRRTSPPPHPARRPRGDIRNRRFWLVSPAG